MPEETPRLGLMKPLGTDNFNRAAYNENLDILEQKVETTTGAQEKVNAHANDSVKHITASERTNWNGKANASVATTSANGLMSAGDKSKLDGIAAGANNYTHPASHPPSIITQDANNRFSTDAEKAAWNAKETPAGAQAKVDTHANDTTKHITAAERSSWNAKASTSPATQSNNGLMSAGDKTKLDGVATGANNYVHPATHPPAIIAQDANNRFVSDSEKTAWNAKASTAVATTSANGLMSSADKSKLDGVAAGAQANRSISTQAQAEAGSDNTTDMTPLRTLQAIDSRTRYGPTTGSATAYLLTLSPAPPSLYTGLEVKFKVHLTNSGAPTLNVNSLGAKSLRDPSGGVLTAGDLEAGTIYTFVYDGTNFILCSGGGDARVDFDRYYMTRDFNSVSATELSAARRYLRAASVGNYALFAGGAASSRLTTVDAYSASLSRTIPTALSDPRSESGAASVGNFALFAGGIGNSTSTRSAVVDAYNPSLTRTSPTALTEARSTLSGASVGNYALFAGGGMNESSNVVDAYNTSLTRTTPAALSVGRRVLAGASVGNYALFAGGYGSSTTNPLNAVDAYDSSLTRTTPAALTAARWQLSGALAGHYALFAGGNEGTTPSSAVDAFDASLTRTTPVPMSENRAGLSGSSIGNYALFGGGSGTNPTFTTVETYDQSLTRTSIPGFSEPRSNLASASVGNYSLFAGGQTSSTNNSSAVDALSYYDASAQLFIPAGSKFNFGSGEQTATTARVVSVPNPITGYIKYKKGVLTG